MAETLKARMQAGETVLGLLNPYGDPNQAELLAMSGWDFIIFDAEHGSLGPREVQDLVRACERRGCTPLVRTPGREPHMVNRFLDAGSRGIMAPMINDAAGAAELVRAVKYPPLGARGLAPTRAASFGLAGTLSAYIESANSETLVIAQIETAEAVDRVQEILACDQVDVVFIGPADLSTSLGHCMDLKHPKVIGAIQNVARAVAGSGKHLGILIAQPEQAAMARSLGARFIACYMDSVLVGGCRGFVNAARGANASQG
ncbi:HpcH/HpaI aldolase family protein [Steroidobacter cummioxidans]|uniref:HpcH/HpaI aldolase family protein n=1 Tax=Steroidobacter cummioxidans TaxID=1803913 RepID=UPI00129042C4|nr:aldolase/citrate lyase family protein [Steroidobacter cummioxidans]